MIILKKIGNTPKIQILFVKIYRHLKALWNMTPSDEYEILKAAGCYYEKYKDKPWHYNHRKSMQERREELQTLRLVNKEEKHRIVNNAITKW
jgi:hypothetical protein